MVGEILLNGAGKLEAVKSDHRIVLKFGGTSVGKFASQIAEICRSTASEQPIAVVCSARSGRVKTEGTTNRLLKAAREAAKPGPPSYKAIVDEILQDHIEATEILSQKAAAKAVRDFTADCENLNLLLSTFAQTGSTPELEDETLSYGERLSAQFLAILFEDRGLSAEYVNLARIIDFDTNQGLDQNFYQQLAGKIGERVKLCGDRIPVITGYFGQVPGGLLENCGRGYSDLLAALVAVGVEGKELQVWKEVSGVYTADPRKVPTATPLSSIHPAEANELTFYGSEVIHHYTVEQCIPKIPIRIKNVTQPDDAGTIISVDHENKDNLKKSQLPKKPTAVTSKQSITVVNVHSDRKVGSPEFLAKICTTLDRYSLQVDLFELNEMHVSLAVHSKDPFVQENGNEDQEELEKHHLDLELCIRELKNYGAVDVKRNMAIVSLIGLDLRESIGIAGRFFTALGNNNINIEMISQGASEINISCVIHGRQALQALNVVHTALFTFLDPIN